MVQFHARLANTVVLYMLLVSLWGFWRFFRKQGVDSSYWGGLVIAAILPLVQALVGVMMLLMGLTPGRGLMHILYGVVAVITIPGVYFYTRGTDDRPTLLLYATATLFLAGIALRAITTGGGG